MALGIAGGILYLVRRDRIHGSFALWWIVVAACVALLGFFPRLADHVAPLLGVSYPPILFVVAALGLLLVKMLTMDLERSRQERKLRRLIQRLAILEAALEQHRREATDEPPEAGAHRRVSGG